jgi:hypothetical protein
MMMEGCHLPLEEGGDDMVSRDALVAQFPNASHDNGKLTIVRIGLLPIGLAN